MKGIIARFPEGKLFRAHEVVRQEGGDPRDSTSNVDDSHGWQHFHCTKAQCSAENVRRRPGLRVSRVGGCALPGKGVPGRRGGLTTVLFM